MGLNKCIIKTNDGTNSIKSNKSRVTFSDLETIELDSLEIDFEKLDEIKVLEEEDVCVLNVVPSDSSAKKCPSSFQTNVDKNEDAKRLDLGDSGLQQIPEIFLQSPTDVEELLAGRNKLQELALRALAEFTRLKVLRLNGNGLKSFPESLLSMRNLRVLDLEENEIRKLPEKVALMTR